jgi:hypothetical protein
MAATQTQGDYMTMLNASTIEKMWKGYGKLMVEKTAKRVRLQLYVFIGLIVLNGIGLLTMGWGFTLGILFFAPPLFASMMFLQYRIARRKGKAIQNWLRDDPPEDATIHYRWNEQEISWSKQDEITRFLWAECVRGEEFEEVLYVFGVDKKLLFMLPKTLLGTHYATLRKLLDQHRQA